jgi:hypothetical protein
MLRHVIAYDDYWGAKLQEAERSSVYLFKFREDMQYGVGGFRDDSHVDIACDPPSASAIVAAIVSRNGYEDDTGKRFLRRVGAALAMHGDAHYQLVESDHDPGLRLVTALPETVLSSRTAYVQVVPQGWRTPRLAVLSGYSMHSIESGILSPRSWRRHIRRVAWMERYEHRSAMAQMQSGSYSFTSHHRLVQAAVIREMSFIDWPLTYGLKPEMMTEIDFSVRWLRFQRRLIGIRSRAMDTLNALLAAIGAALCVSANAQLVNYPAEEEYAEAEGRLLAGAGSPAVLRSFHTPGGA